MTTLLEQNNLTDMDTISTIEIKQVHSNMEVRNLMESIIRLYKQVFGESEWEEGFKCNKCGKKWRFSNAPVSGVCSTLNCGTDLVEFYPNEEVEQMILKLVSNIQYRLFIALSDKAEELIGFSWGWFTDINTLNTDKLKISNSQLESLRQNIQRLFGMVPKSLYYQSETGVEKKYRGKNIAAGMIQKTEDSLPKGTLILQRTTQKSPMFRIRLNAGYQVVFGYEDEDQRVLFAKLL